jgi:hypothetical protein
MHRQRFAYVGLERNRITNELPFTFYQRHILTLSHAHNSSSGGVTFHTSATTIQVIASQRRDHHQAGHGTIHTCFPSLILTRHYYLCPQFIMSAINSVLALLCLLAPAP